MEPKKKKRGRPPKGRIKRSISLRLEEWRVVSRLAEYDGVSMSDAMTEIIMAWAKSGESR